MVMSLTPLNLLGRLLYKLNFYLPSLRWYKPIKYEVICTYSTVITLLEK